MLLNPIDLCGIPYPNRETRQADWLAPSFLPHVECDGAAGIILYDEITSAPRAPCSRKSKNVISTPR
ncbi:MAG: hypothetical protein ACOX86_06550 [Pelotomaculaceae bacterium]